MRPTTAFIASQLRAHRARLRLSQAAMARAVQVTLPAYGSYEEGRAEPKLATLLRMATFLRCSLDVLCGHSLTTPTPTPAPVALEPRKVGRPAKYRPAARTARPCIPPLSAPQPGSSRPFVTWP